MAQLAASDHHFLPGNASRTRFTAGFICSIAMRAFAIDDKHFVPRIPCHPGGGHLAPRRKSSIVDPVKTGNLGASSTLPVTARCRTIFGRSVGVAVQMRTPRSRLISSAALLCATHVATASFAADVQIDVFNYCTVENVSVLCSSRTSERPRPQ